MRTFFLVSVWAVITVPFNRVGEDAKANVLPVRHGDWLGLGFGNNPTNREHKAMLGARETVVRLERQTGKVANAHVEKDRDKGDVGNERDEEHEFGVCKLVHEGSFL